LDQFCSQVADEQSILSNLEAIGQIDSFDAIPCHQIVEGQDNYHYQSNQKN